MITSEPVNRDFAIGDQVVHPQHGVGLVSGLEEKQFGPDAARLYYVVSIPDTTIWVPVGQSNSGLRKMGSPGDVEECRQVLQAAPQALSAGRELLPALSARIRQGTIVIQCEVVRDLTAFGWHKPLYGPISDFQRTALNVLCQEWAAVVGVTQVEAAHEIHALLRKSRAARDQ